MASEKLASRDIKNLSPRAHTTPTAARIGLQRSDVDRGPICIKGAKQARLIKRHFRLQPHEGVFSDKERPLHRAVMPPEPHGTPGRIENAAFVRKIEHSSLTVFFSFDARNPALSQTFSIARPPIIALVVASRHPEGLQMAPDCDRSLFAGRISTANLDRVG